MREEIDLLVRGEHADPFRLLGPHAETDALHVRVFRPGATQVEVLPVRRDPVLAKQLDPAGFFEAILPSAKNNAYRLRVTYPSATIELHDPYAFPSMLTEFDQHLMAEGTHYQEWEKLGAHIRASETTPSVKGVHFAVWAPNARRVSVVGDFNQWDGRVHPMRFHPTGVWEIFIPGLGEGEIYKFEMLPPGGGPPFLKSDPYGFHAEVRPKSGSVVFDLTKHKWEDGEWQSARTERNRLEAPISVYEVHVGS